ncbi:type II toxin-antitoxin system PemK/MazF family toxin [Nodularia spumigena CS-591/12]|uniref:type II toxin-antitoxin system PemK/MazF family toxin n=1 Tax=Nodularia spumigena TaxID=70799 RepID=UPI00232EF778|nr:type II toxin-antitoxin system PemK/MazF family toxin [Nodularia spumigena]MDB9306333.1 type II toxin-antitoxin system PemK/MazF family toxin [Nodularia spumigena CS-591/12]MDB9347809.1 type II toxin-antitoxin system PemK/MazF family toxin [Nodularia spumigena CS-588/01]MDB9350555.1 type II toxin-antitoxin system PemK/MazF family toxin [Nodularia spumigena CS-588/05]
MKTIQAGEFWVANIPFSNGGGVKKRPILVLWLDGDDVVAAVVTSAKPRTQTDVPLNDWATSGLRVSSTVRLSRLDCLEQPLLLAKIGQVSESDAQRLKEVWDLYIKLQF